MENISMSQPNDTFEVTELPTVEPPTPQVQPQVEPVTPPPPTPQPLQFSNEEGFEAFKAKVKDYVDTYSPLLYILTPCYNGNCDVNYILSLVQTLELFNLFNFPISVLFCRNDSLITRARNNLIAKAMTNPKTTHIMFIDSDITWSGIDVMKLVLSNKPVIGGVYPLKTYNWKNMVVDKQNQVNPNIVQTLLEKHDSTVLKNVISKEDFIQSSLLSYNVNFLDKVLNVSNNIAKVKHVATGFLMIQRDTIVKMINQFPHTKYVDDTGFLEEEENKYAYALFNTEVAYNHFLSEDWLFCDRWEKMDGEIYIDVSIILNHIGVNDYKGCFLGSVL